MTLPEFLQPDSPYRPWAIVLIVCLLACLPRGSRRLGSILFIVVGCVAVIYFFLSSTYDTMIPSDWNQ